MNYRIHLWSLAQSPITQMMGVEGNEALVNREPVSLNPGTRWVPCLSGNALRHRCVREPGGLWLIERLGLKGSLSLKQLNFIIHGGNLTDSTGREDTARIAEMQDLFPLFRLLGGALPDQILRGSLMASRGMLVCEENRPFLPANLPDGFALPTEALKRSEDFIEDYQYTRGEGAPRAEWYDPETRDPDAKSNLMIFAGGQVIRGAAFSHGFHIPHGSELEYGCLMHALGLWQEEGGIIGGQSSKGHGRLATSVLGGDDPADAIAGYIDHVESHIEPCRAWLEKVFRAKPEKPAKPAKGKGKADAVPAA